MVLKLHVLAFIIALLPILNVCADDDVLTFTDDDFESKIKQHSIILVEFFAPWCGHCKALAPEYSKAATALMKQDPPVHLAKVDCIEGGKKTCEKFGVSGYPTLKIFKNGVFAFDYDGGRTADAITKYMITKSGPSSKELKTESDLTAFLDKAEEAVIVGYILKDGSDLHKTFQSTADGMSEQLRFAHTTAPDVLKKSGYSDAIVIHRPKHLKNKFEDSSVKVTGNLDVDSIKSFIEDNVMGLCGHRTTSNVKFFEKKPLVVAYYNVDYKMNPKGTNYWRNRVMKVAKKVREASGKSIYFAVSNSNDFSYETDEFGLDVSDGKVHITARNADNKKFKMDQEFSMPTFEKWLTELLDDKLTPHLKSEEIPTDNSAPVKVAVAKNFDTLVNDPNKDVLIEFYAPWCGHCKNLAPKYDELAEKLKDEPEIAIVKMDATANDVPSAFSVQGFPTIYFAPKGNKSNPKQYNGGREVKDFIEYLARESTNPLKGYDRSGKPKKTEL